MKLRHHLLYESISSKIKRQILKFLDNPPRKKTVMDINGDSIIISPLSGNGIMEIKYSPDLFDLTLFLTDEVDKRDDISFRSSMKKDTAVFSITQNNK